LRSPTDGLCVYERRFRNLVANACFRAPMA
jgi:hypothetical protein